MRTSRSQVFNNKYKGRKTREFQLQALVQWRNIGTVTPATPGAPLQGGAKLHEYIFSKIRLKDGRRTKKFIGGITEPELTTVDGQNIIGGAKSLVGAQKSGEQKKVAIKNVGN